MKLIHVPGQMEVFKGVKQETGKALCPQLVSGTYLHISQPKPMLLIPPNIHRKLFWSVKLHAPPLPPGELAGALTPIVPCDGAKLSRWMIPNSSVDLLKDHMISTKPE